MYFVFFKQKPAYEMRISDWSSDVCSSDLLPPLRRQGRAGEGLRGLMRWLRIVAPALTQPPPSLPLPAQGEGPGRALGLLRIARCDRAPASWPHARCRRLPSQIGRAHVCTPVTNAHLVCRPLLDKKKQQRATKDTK